LGVSANQTCKVDLPGGPTDFRSTVVKPYLREAVQLTEGQPTEAQLPSVELRRAFQPDSPEQDNQAEPADTLTRPQRQRRLPVRFREPDGTYSTAGQEEPTEGPDGEGTGGMTGLPAITGAVYINGTIFLTENTEDPPSTFLDTTETLTFPEEMDDPSSTFLTAKEASDLALSAKLRAEGKIRDKEGPFEASRRKEIEGLMEKGVFELVPYDRSMDGKRIFRSRFVDEVKGKGTDNPFEKSRLVVQAFADNGKKQILTQSPTIQRVSQRLLLSLAATLPEYSLYLRDVSQAYVQSTTPLARTIFAFPPRDLKGELPPDTVLRIVKPLYGIPEAGTHWFNTYHRHHREKLHMQVSTFDPCLLYTDNPELGLFGVVGLQTDDTLFVANKPFAALEADKLDEAGILAKPRDVLSVSNELHFNGGRQRLEKDGIAFTQKGQADKLALIDIADPDFAKEYVQQRARGAYISSTCQPEAAFDLSIAAQHSKEPTPTDAQTLNTRLKWQMDHRDRGLRFCRLDLATSKLFVFVDGSFAQNRDLSSQIGYIIVWANEVPTSNGDEVTIKGNILHWSSVKCKRVTRSVLASELYGMVHGIDIAMAIQSTLDRILKSLQTSVPTVVCTDSRSLYDCMVKLGTTTEKRLMIDVMAVREAYERRELSEFRWIEGPDNPADAMTKAKPNKALERLVDTNELRMKVVGWVDRPGRQ